MLHVGAFVIVNQQHFLAFHIISSLEINLCLGILGVD